MTTTIKSEIVKSEIVKRGITQRGLNITYCNKVRTTSVLHKKQSFLQLALAFTSSPVVTTDRESLEWPLFVPFKMLSEEEGAHMSQSDYGEFYSRSRANVEFMDMLVIDIDNDPGKGRPYLSFEDAQTIFAKYSCILYTSYNHLSEYKHNVDKFRVILPLADIADLSDVEERREALTELFPWADPASFTASQPFYVPIAHPDRVEKHRTFWAEGEWFDLLGLKAKEKIVRAPVSYISTGERYTDLPMIQLASGSLQPADQVFDSLHEGYENRVQCYRINGADSKPGCFVYRTGASLAYYDNAVGKTQYFKIEKTQIVEDDDDDVDTPSTLWARRAGQKQASESASNTALDDVRRRSRGDELPLIDFGTPLVMNFTERYLPSDLYGSFPDKGVVVIKSPKGTGKTELLKFLVDECEQKHRSVMLLGHRVYLLKNLATRTNLDYYLDLPSGETTSSMVLCLNSLTRMNPAIDRPYHTLIIDESEQVLQALLSPTLRGDLSTVFNNLIWLFRKAKRVICLDADLSFDLTIELIKELRGTQEDDEVLGIINDYAVGQGQTTKLYENRNHLIADAFSAIDAGEKVFITTNSRKWANILAAASKSIDKRTLLVTSETNELPEVKAFINDPEYHATQYDVVVASPTLSTGVSIDGNHFTRVFGVFGINPGTYQDADQALSRVRSCSNVSVWIQGHSNPPTLQSEESIYNDILDKERGTIKRIYSEDVEMTQGQLLWARIYARIQTLVSQWSVCKDEKLTALRREMGYTVEMILNDPESSDLGKSIMQNFKDDGSDRAQDIFNAPSMTFEEIDHLLRKKQRSYQERLLVDRFNFESKLKDDFTLDNLRRALKMDFFKAISHINILHNVDDLARNTIDKKSRERNKSTFTSNRHSVMQKELLDYIYKKSSIDPDKLYAKVMNEREVEIDKATLLSVAESYASKTRDYNFYFNARISDPTNDRNLIKVWNATIGTFLSLPLKKMRRGPRESREMHYFIDYDKVDLILRASLN